MIFIVQKHCSVEIDSRCPLFFEAQQHIEISRKSQTVFREEEEYPRSANEKIINDLVSSMVKVNSTLLAELEVTPAYLPEVVCTLNLLLNIFMLSVYLVYKFGLPLCNAQRLLVLWFKLLSNIYTNWMKFGRYVSIYFLNFLLISLQLNHGN